MSNAYAIEYNMAGLGELLDFVVFGVGADDDGDTKFVAEDFGLFAVADEGGAIRHPGEDQPLGGELDRATRLLGRPAVVVGDQRELVDEPETEAVADLVFLGLPLLLSRFDCLASFSDSLVGLVDTVLNAFLVGDEGALGCPC